MTDSLDISLERDSDPLLHSQVQRLQADLQQAQVALQAYEARWQALQRHNHHTLIFALERQGAILFANFSPTEMLPGAVHPLDLIVPADRPAVEAAIAQVLRDDTEASLEVRLTGRGDKLAWYALHLSPIVQDGAVVAVLSVSHDITSRRHAEEALAERQLTLATLMTNLPGMAYRCRNDPHWTMLFVSEGCAALTGYRPDELIDNRAVAYAELIHPDDRAAVWQAIQQSVETGLSFQCTYRLRTRDGAEKWVWEQGRQVTLPDGQTVLDGFITDITETVEARARQSESETRYRTLFESMTQGVVFQDRNGVITESNPAAARILGLAQDEMRGRSSLDPRWYAIREDGTAYPGAEHPAMTALRTGQPVRDAVIGVYNPEQGEYRWLIVNAIPQARPGEDRPSLVYTLFRDITEQQRFEQALRESQARLQAMFDNAASAIALLDANLRYVRTNEQWRRMFGYDASALDPLSLCPSDEVEQAAAQYQVLQRGEGDAFQMEQRFVRADGSVFWGAVSARAVRDPQGRLESIVQTIVDITARREAEAESLKLAMEQERVNILARFIEDVSHEFRTPLAILYTGLDLLHRESGQQQAMIRRLDAMKEQAHYIGTLVEDMLTLTQLDGQRTFNIAPLDLNQVMRDLHTEFAPLAQERQITLTVETPPQSVRLRGHISSLNRALRNLIDNGLEFTPPGGTVSLSVTIEQGMAAVRVRDTGCGIGAEHLPHIFERFYRGDQARTSRHAGLGLSIARRIIELHGGTIEVSSQAGQGTVFAVYLPLMSV